MRLVHMTNITYCASQKKPAQKPAASNQPPKTTAHSEAGPAKVPDETKPEPSGAPDNEEVRVRFLRLPAGTHNNYCSQVNRPRPLRAQWLVPPMFQTKQNLSLLVHTAM
jgi:hypothetical protein